MRKIFKIMSLLVLAISFVSCFADDVRYGDTILLRRDAVSFIFSFAPGGYLKSTNTDGKYVTSLSDRYLRSRSLGKRRSIDLKYNKGLLGDDCRWVIVHPDPAKKDCRDILRTNESRFLLRSLANDKIYIGCVSSSDKNSHNPINESTGKDKEWMFVLAKKSGTVKNVESEGYVTSLGGDMVAIKNIETERFMRGHNESVNTNDKIGNYEEWWVSIQPK